MHSSYQMAETHHANLSLSIHDRINDLHRRAERLAPAVEQSAADSGCTDMTRASYEALGPRQRQAWDMVAEALSWNAISDSVSDVNQAERFEAEEIPYRIKYVGGMDPQANPYEVEQLRRITTKGSRTRTLTGDKDRHGNLYVQFDDGSVYSVPESAIMPEPEPLADPASPDWRVQVWQGDGWQTTLSTADEGEARYELFRVVMAGQDGRTVRVVPPAAEDTRWPEGKIPAESDPEPTGEFIQLPPEAVEKFALAKEIADAMERCDAQAGRVHVRTPGKAYDSQGKHTGPGQWLSLIHEANRISPEMFGQSDCSRQPEGWTEEYADARVIHRSDESVSVISRTVHGSEVLAEAARRLGL